MEDKVVNIEISTDEKGVINYFKIEAEGFSSELDPNINKDGKYNYTLTADYRNNKPMKRKFEPGEINALFNADLSIVADKLYPNSLNVTINGQTGKDLTDVSEVIRNDPFRDIDSEFTRNVLIIHDEIGDIKQIYFPKKMKKNGETKKGFVIDIDGVGEEPNKVHAYYVDNNFEKTRDIDFNGEAVDKLEKAMQLFFKSGFLEHKQDILNYRVYNISPDGKMELFDENVESLKFAPLLMRKIYEQEGVISIERTQINQDMLEGLKLDLSSPKSLDGQEEYAGVPYNPEAMAGKSGGQGKA